MRRGNGNVESLGCKDDIRNGRVEHHPIAMRMSVRRRSLNPGDQPCRGGHEIMTNRATHGGVSLDKLPLRMVSIALATTSTPAVGCWAEKGVA